MVGPKLNKPDQILEITQSISTIQRLKLNKLELMNPAWVVIEPKTNQKQTMKQHFE